MDDVEDSALVPRSALAVLLWERLPAHLVGPVDVSQDRLLRLRSSRGIPDDVLQGLLVRSPVEGVRARRWVHAVTAAVDRHGPEMIERALTSDGFHEVEHGFAAVEDQLVDCRDCGELVRRSGINRHRAASTLCRWRRAAAEVRSLWDAGARDPFTVPGAPLSWDGLQKTHWRSRVHTIKFPLWVAVLLSPERRESPRSVDPIMATKARP